MTESIAVLGGGPGAATAALFLARAGAEVTLFRPGRPGEKPCGGALPGYLLSDLDGFDCSGLPAVESPQAVLENAHGFRVQLRLDGLQIYRRRDLDDALVAAAVTAGAREVPAKVRGLQWRQQRPVVEADGVKREFDWVVGGDGARGISRRSLGLQPQGESIGLGASLSGVEESRLVVAFPDAGDSYLWIFPRPGGASVGIAYSEQRLGHGAAKGILSSFLRRHLGGDLDSWPGPRYRYPIPVFGDWTLRSVRTALGRRILLVGDAAAVADPLTREGIRWAVLSGRWAAETIASGRPRDYPGRLEAALAPEMERAERARYLFFDDPIGQWMVPVCRLHRGVRRVLGGLLTCRQPYTGLRYRLLRSLLSP